MPDEEAGPGASREWRRTPYRQSGAAKKEAPEGTARRDGKDGPQIVRSGGKRWTDAAEAKFLDLLAATNNVTLSAAETGFSKEAIYRRRRNDAAFATRWQAALDQGYARVEMLVVQVAADTLEGRAPDPDCPIPPMTVREAITLLQLHRASVKGDGTTRRAGRQGRVRSLDEVRESILRKLAAFDRHDPPRNGRSEPKGSDDLSGSAECPRREGDHAQHGGGVGAPVSNSGLAEPVEAHPSSPSAQEKQERPSTSSGKPVTGSIFTRIVIGVDPPAGDGTCGIIACAKDEHGIAHVLADHSVTARTPEGWATAVATAAAIHSRPFTLSLSKGCSSSSLVPSEVEGRLPDPLPVLIVAETNQGGKMVKAILHTADPNLAVKPVTASLAKADRAAPVAHLFEAGKVLLHGRFPELEAQLLGLIAGRPYQGPGDSPDRADAMVWALTELMLSAKGSPSVRAL